MWWATTSCSSRAIRARSPRAVCSTRLPAMTSPGGAVLGGLAAGPPGGPGPRRRRAQRGQQHGEDPGLGAAGPASASTRNGSAEAPRPAAVSRCGRAGTGRPAARSAGHGQRVEGREGQHARRGRPPPRPPPGAPTGAQRQRGEQREQHEGDLQIPPRVRRCRPRAARSPGPPASHRQQRSGHGGRVRGRGDPPQRARPSRPRQSPARSTSAIVARWPASVRPPGQASGRPSRGGCAAAGVPRASDGEDGSPA